MQDDFIRITKQREHSWSVLRGQRNLRLLTFKLKSHAVAYGYGRAMACSSRLALFVDDRNGNAVRQSSSSLTYPVFPH